jgi:hypothetical protein
MNPTLRRYAQLAAAFAVLLGARRVVPSWLRRRLPKWLELYLTEDKRGTR